MFKKTFVFTLISISTMMTGCASTKDTVFGKNMPTMKTIHDQKFKYPNGQQRIKPNRPPIQKTDNINAETSINSDFQWLANPTLILYVFPHLTEAGHPIPGYSTVFKMYTQDHIAQPGEQVQP